MSSQWIRTRALRDGSLSFAVNYRIGGREAPVRTAGTYRRLDEAERAREALALKIAGGTFKLPSRTREKLVYFATLGNQIKIGIAFDPDKRCRDLNAVMVHVEPGGREREFYLHKRFERHRTQGEWFAYAPEIRDYLAAATAVDREGPLKVIVFGSRSWCLPEMVRDRLALLPKGTTIVHGDSPGGGADEFADRFARELGFDVIPVAINDEDRARAREIGRPRYAPIARNVRMGRLHRDANLAIGFLNGPTKGSKHMRGVCEQAGIPVEIVEPPVPPRVLVEVPA